MNYVNVLFNIIHIKNDLIFDPFTGSGTVGRTAKALGRFFLLTEQDQKYFEYMKTKKAKDIFDTFVTKFFSLDKFVEHMDSDINRTRS